MTDDVPEAYKEMGPERVRLLLDTGGVAPSFYLATIKWLGGVEAERLEKEHAATKATSDLQLRLTRSANGAAWIAAIAAIIAAILSAIPLFR